MAHNNQIQIDRKSDDELGDPFSKQPNDGVGKGPQSSESASESPVDIEAEPQKPSKHKDYGSTDDHVFSDPRVAEYWRGVYENATYEGRHRFDPEFTWTAEEELALKRKIDWRIITWAWMMFVRIHLANGTSCHDTAHCRVGALTSPAWCQSPSYCAAGGG